MPNIKFSYLYRDGGNYKNYGSVIFENSNGITLETLNATIQSKLIDRTWFYAEAWGLPDLRLNPFDVETDPTWHEFESVEYTADQATICFSIGYFIEMLVRTFRH